MKRAYAAALGAATLVGLGAGIMFFLDPKSGHRRRDLVANKARHGYRVAADCTRRTNATIANRTRGVLAMARRRANRETEPPADDVLLARVRSRLGHVVSDTGALEVKTDHGLVSLAGTIGVRDARKVIKTVAATPGVAIVENHLAIETTR